MKSKNPYVRLLNFMRISNNEDTGFSGCEEVMAYMHEASSNGKTVKITDLVQSLQFGTGPTVHRKVTELQERGMIEVKRSPTDGRASRSFCRMLVSSIWSPAARHSKSFCKVKHVCRTPAE